MTYNALPVSSVCAASSPSPPLSLVMSESNFLSFAASNRCLFVGRAPGECCFAVKAEPAPRWCNLAAAKATAEVLLSNCSDVSSDDSKLFLHGLAVVEAPLYLSSVASLLLAAFDSGIDTVSVSADDSAAANASHPVGAIVACQGRRSFAPTADDDGHAESNPEVGQTSFMTIASTRNFFNL